MKLKIFGLHYKRKTTGVRAMLSIQCPQHRGKECRLLDEKKATDSQFQTPALTHRNP